MRTAGTWGALTVGLQTAKADAVRHTCAQSFAEDGVERAVAGGPPTAFRIWSKGMIATDHGDHIFTKDSAARLLSDQKTRGNRFSIDVDHMSLDSKAPPANHRAVGWFSIDVRDGDLWAVNVEWTDEVREGLTKSPPEWRYFSPAYETAKKTGEVVRLLNLALTNNPATHDVTALATVATEKEKAAMADDEKKEMTLSDMVAAYEGEKDEGVKSAMKSALRAKLKAVFGEGKDDEKEEPKKEETKATADGDADDKKKEETKAAVADVTATAASISDLALQQFEAKRKAAEDNAEKTRILASLPAGDRKTYEDLSLDQVKRIVARHHTDALAHFTAASRAMPTRGAGETDGQRASRLPPDERRELDAKMGLAGDRPIVEEKDFAVVFHGGSPEQATRFLTSMAKEQEKGARTEAEALERVFTNMKGVGQ